LDGARLGCEFRTCQKKKESRVTLELAGHGITYLFISQTTQSILSPR
jgi:hypothetical protein